MSSVVFILGAGASKKSGAPLMNDFLDKASRLYLTSEVNDKKQHFELVFNAISNLQQVHSKSQLDLNNIESIFNTFEMARILNKLPGFSNSKIEEVINSLKEVIVTTLEMSIKFPIKNNYVMPPEPYEDFCNLCSLLEKIIPKQSVSIITFNYDIAIDMAITRMGKTTYYGLEKENKMEDSISLLKLHGSLNWAIDTNSKQIIPLYLTNYLNKFGNYMRSNNNSIFINIGSKLQEYVMTLLNLNVQPEPVIVPPSWNKADHYQALANVWQRAVKELEEAEYIFIIGYSLPETDAFFKLLFALGTVGKTLLKRIVVFNPDNSGVTEMKFKSILGPGAVSRFEYKPYTFENQTVGKFEGNTRVSEVVGSIKYLNSIFLK